MHTRARLLTIPLLAVLVAACSSGATPSPSAAPPSAPASAAASAAASAPASAAASAAASAVTSAAPAATIAAACMKGQAQTKTSGTLTIGTDNPAYPPYFQPPASGNAPKPWELGDPTNGQGFESAVAYAVADKLGFSKNDVKWIVVPFNNSFKPGAKDFDFYLAQVSYTADRAKAVDMSDGYYYVAQSIVALKGSKAADAKSVADLKGLNLGAQAGTTAYDTIQNVIQPTSAAKLYDSNDAAIQALKAKQIDAIVVDLPTAFYITAVQLPNSVIAGQLPVQQGPNAEHFSLVLAKGSPLTSCVNQAIAALKADGQLDQITKEWLSDKASAPILQP